jgi:two-component system, NtrC family, response regulator HydG
MSFVPRVLIVDDEETAPEAFARMLPRERYVCEVAPTVARADQCMRRSTFDVVVAVVHMDGLALLDRVKRDRPSLSVILLSARAGIQEAVDAIKRGAFHYLAKPCAEAEFIAAVDGAIAARRRSPASPSDGFGILPAQPPGRDKSSPDERRAPAIHTNMELVGAGRAMSKLRETIGLVAASSAPVLITGASGVGKELVARAIHAESLRRAGAFVAVNTSAIPGDLLEAEIFGHARGGFTGAVEARKGLLTQASGGTLLLDEIGDMPLDLQAKILRVLQFSEVRPVGSDRAHHVDVRMIAATHRDLPALVHEGRFREDLYFRLNVLPVAVPPLHERREDIPALVAHHLAQALLRSPGSPVRSIGTDALEILMAAPWPGNVRELASAVERIVVFCHDEEVAARHLSDLSLGAPAAGPPPAAPTWTMQRVKRAYAEQVLAQTGGNKQRAAEILNIDLSTLYRWERVDKSSPEAGLDIADAAPPAERPGARRRGRRSRDPASKKVPLEE